MSSNGRIEPPEVLLRKARNRPHEPAVLLEIGLYLLTGRHAEQAREVFELGRAAAPERPEFDLGIGASLMQQSQFERACRHLEQHLVRFPGSAVGYFHRATALYELDRHEEMMAQLLKSITLAPSNQQALAFFYNHLTAEGDAGAARAALERIGEDLRAAGPRLFLARRSWDEGDWPEAGGLLDQALLDGVQEDPEALAEAARLLVELGRAEECVELVEDRAELLAFDPLATLAEAYRLTEETEQAAALVPRLRELVTSTAQQERLAAFEEALREA